MTTTPRPPGPPLIFRPSREDWTRWTDWARRACANRDGQRGWLDAKLPAAARGDRVVAVAHGRAAEALWIRYLGGDEALLPGAEHFDGGLDFTLRGQTYAVRFSFTPDADLWFDTHRPLRAQFALLACAVRGAPGVVELAGWASRGEFEVRAHPPDWPTRVAGVRCLKRNEIVDARDRLP